MNSQLRAENEALAERADSLREQAAGVGLCAIDLADQHGASLRQELVREALSQGAEPSKIGIAFVVAISEWAYDIDWSDHYSFWPRLDALLLSRTWHHRDSEHRIACAAAFTRFAERYGGLRPAGQFARSCPHMSWPLFHAVLPRAAHRRMAKLLAAAAADPRLAVAADGCPDEASLGDLLRGFALTGDHPAYFEGLLAHPTLIGRLASRLLRPARSCAAPEGDSHLLARILRDLQGDAVASQAVKAARAESAHRAAESLSRRLETPPLSISLALVNSRAAPRLEIGQIPREARESRSLRPLLEGAQLRLDADVRGERFPCGAANNLLFGPVAAPFRWPDSADEFSIALLPQDHSGKQLDDYFGRVLVSVKLPRVFVDASGSGLFEMADEVEPGQRVAIVVRREVAAAQCRLAEQMGLSAVALDGTSKATALLGRLASERVAVCRRLAEALGIRITEHRPALVPSLVPPLRSGRGWAEWREGVDAFVAVNGAVPASAWSAQFVGAEGSVALHAPTPATGGVLCLPAALGAGRLTLRAEGLPSLSFDVRRSPRPQHREAVRRLRAHVVPKGASVGHLLADACGCDIATLPGVPVRIGVRVDGEVAMADLCDGGLGPLATAEVLGALWRRLGGERIADASRVEVLVEDADAAGQSLISFDLPRASGFVHFEESDRGSVARAVTSGEAPVASVVRYALTGEPLNAEGDVVSTTETLGPASAPGLYVARASDGEEAAIVWAPDVVVGAGVDAAELAPTRDVEAGAGSALEVLSRLRQMERAAVGPQRCAGSALMQRGRGAAALRRRLIGALCGARWIAAVAEWEQSRLSVVDLARVAAPLLWVPRRWLRDDLPAIAATTADVLAATRAMCQEGVGDALSRDDMDRAGHLALIMTRASLVAPDEDYACLRWAAESPLRPRLVHVVALALRTTQQAGLAHA